MQKLGVLLTASVLAISAFALTDAQAGTGTVGAAPATQMFDARGKCKRGYVWDASTKKCVRTKDTRGSF